MPRNMINILKSISLIITKKDYIKQQLHVWHRRSMFHNIKDVPSQDILNKICHVVYGAPYLAGAQKSTRIVLAYFRFGKYMQNSKNNFQSQRICPLWGKSESGYHLIFDCPGVSEDIRLHLRRGRSMYLESIWNAKRNTEQQINIIGESNLCLMA